MQSIINDLKGIQANCLSIRNHIAKLSPEERAKVAEVFGPPIGFATGLDEVAKDINKSMKKLLA